LNIPKRRATNFKIHALINMLLRDYLCFQQDKDGFIFKKYILLFSFYTAIIYYLAEIN